MYGRAFRPLKRDFSADRFRALFGVGGIGAGTFFLLKGNQTLGREESRAGRFLDRRDYCKLHIIAHYVKALLGPEFAAFPIGRVGDDEVGRRLRQEMAAAGLDLRFVTVSPGDQTLFSFCLLYPDGSGGNLTTDDSACARVDAASLQPSVPLMGAQAGHGLALAVPEVPLPARQALLELASRHQLFRVAAFTSAEMREVIETDLLRSVDLLAVNLEEAAAAAGCSVDSAAPEAIIDAALQRMTRVNPRLLVSVTGSARGSWCWDGRGLAHQPAFPAQVASAAGAGDAHLSGILAGLTAGLPLAQAQELGALVAAVAVTSPHTIHDGLDRDALRAFAEASGASLSAAVGQLLREDAE